MSNTLRKAAKRARHDLPQIEARIAEIEAVLPGAHFGPGEDGTPAIEFRLAIAGEEIVNEYRSLVVRRDLAAPHEKDPKRPTGKYVSRKEAQQKRRRDRIAAERAAAASVAMTEKIGAAFTRGREKAAGQ